MILIFIKVLNKSSINNPAMAGVLIKQTKEYKDSF